MEKVLFTWSGGKDSALALYFIQKDGKYEVLALITTITRGYDRVSMHGVRRVLVEAQARSLDIPIDPVFISSNSSNEEYEHAMKNKLLYYQRKGVKSVIFGDVFLEDVRRYREEKLSAIGMQGVFPLWKQDTSEIARNFIELGFKSIITCVDSRVLDKGFVGRIYDKKFLADLPHGVDPCGENGEFHSFVFDGPIFNGKVGYVKGEVVTRGSFHFCELLPIDT